MTKEHKPIKKYLPTKILTKAQYNVTPSTKIWKEKSSKILHAFYVPKY